MKKLIYILFVLITIAFVVAAIAGFATGRINPEVTGVQTCALPI